MILMDPFPPQELYASVRTVVLMSSGSRSSSCSSHTTWRRTLLHAGGQAGVVLPPTRQLSFFLTSFLESTETFIKLCKIHIGRVERFTLVAPTGVTKTSALNCPLETFPSSHLGFGDPRLWLQILWGTVKLMAWFRAWNSLVNIPHMSNGQAFLTQLHRPFCLYKFISSQ